MIAAFGVVTVVVAIITRRGFAGVGSYFTGLIAGVVADPRAMATVGLGILPAVCYRSLAAEFGNELLAGGVGSVFTRFTSIDAAVVGGVTVDFRSGLSAGISP